MMSNLEMTEDVREDVYRLCTNITPFSIRGLGTAGVCTLEPRPHGGPGMAYIQPLCVLHTVKNCSPYRSPCLRGSVNVGGLK